MSGTDRLLDPLFVDGKGRQVAAPDFGGARIADTHGHLDMLEDPPLAIARAALAGVAFIATVCDVTEDGWRTYDSLDAWTVDARALLDEAGHEGIELPAVRVIVGAHPHNSKEYDAQAEEELLRLISDPRTCAMGELGLDYHYDHSPRDIQRETFRRHLSIAAEQGLPVCIHLREAHEDGLTILRECGVPAAGFILHCFNLGAEVMQPFLELGGHVSFAGPATFKKADNVREAARVVPSGRLLTETDCPFMAPEPFRGKTNEPALVAFTAARIADERGDERRDFAEASLNAALALLDRSRS